MIGVCAWCGCTDTLLALVRPGGFTVSVCEFCAHEDRTEHDDKGYEGGERERNDDVDYESDSLGNEIRDASDDGDGNGRGY